jgi:hypothetical protein
MERQGIIMISAPSGVCHPMASLNGLVNALTHHPEGNMGGGGVTNYNRHQE